MRRTGETEREREKCTVVSGRNKGWGDGKGVLEGKRHHASVVAAVASAAASMAFFCR